MLSKKRQELNGSRHVHSTVTVTALHDPGDVGAKLKDLKAEQLELELLSILQ